MIKNVKANKLLKRDLQSFLNEGVKEVKITFGSKEGNEVAGFFVFSK